MKLNRYTITQTEVMKKTKPNLKTLQTRPSKYVSDGYAKNTGDVTTMP